MKKKKKNSKRICYILRCSIRKTTHDTGTEDDGGRKNKQEKRLQIGADKRERKQEGVRTGLPKSMAFDRALENKGREPSTYQVVEFRSEEALQELLRC